MIININNYSLALLSDIKLELNSDIKFNHRSGCNGFVRNSRKKYMYLVIPKKNITQVLTTVKNRSGITYTLDDVLDILKEMSFVYNYIFIDKTIKFMNDFNHGYYVFEIPIIKNHYHRYYSFCMLRHFYYGETVLIDYLSRYHELKDDLEKIISLGMIHSTNTGFYTFVSNRLPIDHNLNFTKLLNYYYYARHNTPGEGFHVNLKTTFNNDVKVYKEFILKNSNNVNKNIRFESEFIISNYLSNDNINIDDKQLMHFKSLGSYYIERIDNIAVNYKSIKIPNEAIILNKPSIINITKNLLPKKHLFLLPKTPEYVINVNKVVRKNHDYNVINDSKIISSLKNRKLVNTLANQKESNTYPFKFVKNIKTKKDEFFIINNEQELVEINKNINIKKYLKEPYYKNSKNHYLFYTKEGLFLYQIKLDDYIIDNSNTDILKYMVKDSTSLISKCHDIFKKSNLDIGVITIKVNTDNDDYFITDISSFIENGSYCTNKYLSELNKLLK